MKIDRIYILLFSALALSPGGCGKTGPIAVVDMAVPVVMVDMAAPPAPDLAPPSIVATARGLPNIAVVGVVDVVAGGATAVMVSYGPTAAHGFRTPLFPIVNGMASVPLLGLAPNDITHVQAIAYHGSSPVAESGDLTLRTSSLPDWLPPLFITTPSDTLPGYVLLSLQQENERRALAVMIDRAGRLQWYWDFQGLWPFAADFQRQPNGNFTVVDPVSMKFTEVDLTGTILRTFEDPLALDGPDPHEFRILPNGNHVFIGTQERMADISNFLPMAGIVTVFGCSIDEFRPDGTSVFHWNSFAEIGLEETLPDIWAQTPLVGPLDSLHPNSLSATPDDNYIISMRHADSIIKVNRSTNRIAWRLGGVHSDFTFVNDPLNGFSHQHFARFTNQGTLLLFDNGFGHMPKLSRAAEYQLDEQAMTATLVWEGHYPGETFAFAGGSAQRLDDGNTLISWCTNARASELDPTGQVIWEVRAPAQTLVYRAIQVPGLYP